MKHSGSKAILALGAWLLVGCQPKTAVAPMSPQEQDVDVERIGPPPGATRLGPIEGIDGSGCDSIERDGTFEGAVAAIKEEAVRRGADYVEIVGTTKPHRETGCFDREFRIRGIAYKLPEAPAPQQTPPARSAPPSVGAAAPMGPPAASASPPVASASSAPTHQPTASAPTASAPAASASASSAPSASASDASAAKAPATKCTPPCSPGYACEAGTCKPLCNPPCGPGQRCRMDRVCEPVTTPGPKKAR